MALALADKNKAGSGVMLRRRAAARAAAGGRAHSCAIAAFMGLGFLGAALLHVWLRLQVVHLGYVLSTTSKLQSQLEQENRQLKVELATLTARERLESLARQQLGMVEPRKGQVVILP